jgi:hypothetical protein
MSLSRSSLLQGCGIGIDTKVLKLTGI